MSINNFFVLASSSGSRRSLLKKAGLNFKSIKPKINEQKIKTKLKTNNISPKQISLKLAKEKARSISGIFKTNLVVGSDTVIDYKGQTIDKANNIKEAYSKIYKLSGLKHNIISSAAIYYNEKIIWSASEKTTIKFRTLKHLQIKEYLEKCGPKILSSVGCYQVEKMGPRIIESIKGDFFNTMGFPLFSFLKFLEKTNEK
tara:strand:- start:2127 stop:2726 length:600 start_codon:yes stop_codon:yes gene_type:complete